MASMYETIMSLPLFKGVSREQVSSFVEKTYVEFQNHSAGTTVVSAGQQCTAIQYILSGEIRFSWQNVDCGFSVNQTLGAGTVIAADRLFGMDTNYPYTGVTLSPTSLMSFSKSEYIALLNSNPIYMLNYLNYLSLRAQRPADILVPAYSATTEGALALIVLSLTEATAKDITVEMSLPSLSGYTNLPIATLTAHLDKLARQGLIEWDEQNIAILSRSKLAETAVLTAATLHH